MKNKLLILAMGFALTTQMVMAQVPSYVPTNGLVGYWPFNGNANDESGNGNNGTVNGATLTTDRLGNADSAYSFDGLDDFISILNNTLCNAVNEVTISTFVDVSNWTINGGYYQASIIQEAGNHYFHLQFGPQNNNQMQVSFQFNNNVYNNFESSLDLNNWHHIAFTHSSIGINRMYIDGNEIQNISTFPYGNSTCPSNIYLGKENNFYYNGKIDDIGIWNRALTQQEITSVYNSTSTNECLTMTINTGVLSTAPVTYTSTVNIYPNPANDQITIDCGNLENVVGWNIKITNMLGQEVFNQPMNTQQYVVPLNTWSGQGMYFVKIINAQNEVVNIKKIILQ